MKTSGLTPTKLRIILSVCMFLLIGAGVGLFMVGYTVIADYSAAARTTAAQAQASNTTLQDLKTTEAQLEANAKTVARASQIVAESKSYVYQDQIIRDINNFATNSGITVTNITFADAVVTPTSVSAPTAGATTSAATSMPTAGAATAAPAGVKSMTATVTLKNPVSFTSMLKFIHSIEGGLFKMRISQVTLSRAADSNNKDEVTSDALTIEVYVR